MMHNKLNIALIGYGKMGKTIEKLAEEKGHSIGLKTNSQNPLHQNLHLLDNIDVAIEFTNPDIASKNLETLASHGVKTVCGSTGWLDEYKRISALYDQHNSAFLYASNFSIGVNIFFALNKKLAKLMTNKSDYKVSMVESHHISKKDAPSGTAVSLAEHIIQNHQAYNNWQLKSSECNTDEISIEAIREGDVKGMHQISYRSEIDEIVIKHEAFNRNGFALGAIMAAEFIANKKGIFNMNDVLDL